MRAVMQPPGTPTRGFRERHAGLATALLACGIVAPVFYIVMNDVVAASIYPGYDRIARPVSELSATYAPSRSVLVALGLVFELLMIAFWIGVWQAARQNRALHVTTALMLGFAALGLLAFPFPMRATRSWAPTPSTPSSGARSRRCSCSPALGLARRRSGRSGGSTRWQRSWRWSFLAF